jgi:uncharacterized repeat protein (TIGR01451 family)
MKTPSKWLALIGFCVLNMMAREASATESGDFLEPLHECHGLTIRLTGPTRAKAGDLVRYRIRVSNGGSCHIQDATVTNFLPREVSLVSAHPEPGASEDSDQETGREPRLPVSRVDWRGVSLMPAETKFFEVRAKVRTAVAREITNSSCAEHANTGRRCDSLDTQIQANSRPSRLSR